MDEKLSALSETLKKTQTHCIMQLCSDWWELTDEEDYALIKWLSASKDERLCGDIRRLICLEHLSIAVVNYFTTSSEFFLPSNHQMSLLRTLIGHTYTNFLLACDVILARLPPEVTD